MDPGIRMKPSLWIMVPGGAHHEGGYRQRPPVDSNHPLADLAMRLPDVFDCVWRHGTEEFQGRTIKACRHEDKPKKIA